MKRALVYSLVIIGVIVVALILLRYRAENIVLAPRVQMLLSLLIVIGSVLLIRRRCEAPALLLLIGSSGWTVFWALDVFSDYTWSKEIGPLDGCLYRHWSLCVLHFVGAIATLCLPIGFLWFALRVTRST
jgi:hypothetical protein